MSTHDLARLFIRFNAALLCFYAMLDATYLGPYLRMYHIASHGGTDLGPSFQNLMAAVFRVAAHLLVAAVLFKYTNRIIALFVRPAEPPGDRVGSGQ